jgi:uncharacterized RDD family membrane protein YckC
VYCSKCGAVMMEGAAFCATCGQAAYGASQFVARPPVGAGTAAPPAVGAVYSSPYAGFWLRFVAHLIDGLIIGIPFLVIFGFVLVFAGMGAAFGNLLHGEDPRAIFAFMGIIFMLAGISLIGGWLYYALMESSSWQATLGKKALSLRVTDLAGRQISFGRASGRHFAKIISSLIPFFIGYIMAGFTEKKQALHDMIASCLVIRKA